jgi:hypothetical protein
VQRVGAWWRVGGSWRYVGGRWKNRDYRWRAERLGRAVEWHVGEQELQKRIDLAWKKDVMLGWAMPWRRRRR